MKNIMKTLAVIGLAGLMMTGCKKDNNDPEVIMSSINVGNTISKAGELVTLKYEYTDFGTYEKDSDSINMPFGLDINIPLTKEKIIFTYGGTISVGFDLKDIVPEVDSDAKTISVKVPEAKILAHTPNPDASKQYVIKDSVMTNTNETLDQFENTKSELMAAKAEQVISDESIVKESVEEYKSLCTAWLNAEPGVSEYKIVFVE